MYHRLSVLFAFFSFIAIAGSAFYGMNEDYYTSSQIDLFLEINRALSVGGGVLSNITALGDPLLMAALLSFLILKNIRIWAALLGATPLSVGLSHAGKALFAMPRPAAIISPDKFIVIGQTLSGDEPPIGAHGDNFRHSNSDFPLVRAR